MSKSWQQLQNKLLLLIQNRLLTFEHKFMGIIWRSVSLCCQASSSLTANKTTIFSPLSLSQVRTWSGQLNSCFTVFLFETVPLLLVFRFILVLQESMLVNFSCVRSNWGDWNNSHLLVHLSNHGTSSEFREHKHLASLTIWGLLFTNFGLAKRLVELAGTSMTFGSPVLDLLMDCPVAHLPSPPPRTAGLSRWK